MSSTLCSSRSYDFTPLDSSAVYVLSSMARQRRTSLSSGGAISPDCDKLERSSSPQSSTSKPNRGHASGTASGATPTKCKRPMNAFMLFAKKYRVEYTQMYPGKDNRYAHSHRSHGYFLSTVHASEPRPTRSRRLHPTTRPLTQFDKSGLLV